MLTQLSTLKSRLAIDPFDLQYDALLTSALTAISFRFDKETNRTLARTENLTQEFDAADTEICLACYPVESVTKFELKQNEAEGWIEQTGIEHLLRRACVLSLSSPLVYQLSTPQPSTPLARATYTGGYVLPGTTATTGQTPLPSDLEQAAVEQVASWFLHRDKVGLELSWPKDGTYQKYIQLPLLPAVQATLKRYERWAI
jgi:hypothetical protein